MIGNKLAHYEITALIGKGGMGEVYRARDTKLDREVAIKLLPREMSSDPERLARFQREARTLASLSHPHIASIHGFEESGEHHFLVMELIEGEDLAERLRRGAIPVEETLSIAAQMAEALEAAHESGVIHRDLKPANVKLTDEGQVKLLDFGLARAVAGSVGEEEDPANSPTITMAFTQAGTILGTAAYMSPEQARGKSVDRRADIWAFGVVLYEMLGGRQLFGGETVSDTLASVLKEQPDWDSLPAETPPMIRTLIERCLQKDPKRRLQSIGEARIAIDELLHGRGGDAGGNTLLSSATFIPDTMAEAPASRRGATWLGWVAAILALPIGILLGTTLLTEDSPPRLRKFLLQPEGLQASYPTQPSLSPDGRRIAYFEATSLRIRDLHGLASIPIPDSDGATAPCWSPDGQWLAFGLRGRIYRVPAEGGTPDVICDVDFTTLDGSAWGEDGRLYLAPDSGPLWVVSEQGGDAQPLFPLGEGESDYHTPTVLPEARGVLFTTHNADGRETIEVFADGVRKVLLKIPGARLEYATWSALPGSKTKGHLIYHRLHSNTGIWAMPFDLDSLEVTGDPFLLDSDGAFPSVGRDGSLLYSNRSGFGPLQLVLVDRSGTIVSRVGEPQEGLGRFSVSPDGGSVLLEAEENGNRDVWLHDIQRGARTRMTFGSGSESFAGWLREGREIFYSGELGGAQSATWARNADGTGEPRPLLNGYAASSVPGSDYIAFVVFGRETTNDLYYRLIDSEEEPQLLLQTPASEVGPALSPDGRFIVYQSSESGGNEVYMMTFPAGDGKWQVSTQGGVWPRWSRAGDEIIFRSGSGGTARMMSVSVRTEPTVQLSSPKVLFTATDAPNLYYLAGFPGYDTLPDSDRLMMLERVGSGQDKTAQLVFVEDWHASHGRGRE